MKPHWGDLPFEDAIALLRGKTAIPTARWADLWGAAHTRAFTVAGAMKADLLVDLRGAVDAALADGESIGQFRKRFDEIVDTHGWQYRGPRKWRTDVIYSTNIRTAYHAGRWRQQQRIKSRRPFLQYKHGESRQPRETHLAWHDMVLSADDTFWDTHYPPNGWGCKCRVRSLGPRDLDRMGISGPDPSPQIETYEWTDRVTGETKSIPVGIDPGWEYNPGKAAIDAWRPDMTPYPPTLAAALAGEIAGAVAGGAASVRDILMGIENGDEM